MTSQDILLALVGITVAGYLFNTILELLNMRVQQREIPGEVAEFYNREKYLRSLDYHRDKSKLDLLVSGLSALAFLGMLLLGGFGFLDSFLRQYVEAPIPLALVFFATLVLLSDWLTLPFQWHATFVIEERYGFNKTTPRTFVTDKLKGYILGALLGAPLLSVLLLLIERIGPGFWLWFGAIAGLFVLFMNMFYTTLIVPLFNRLTPLPDGDLKSGIESFARKVNFPLDSIFVIDGSKRSSKANAFFSGIGSKKKVVLFDTLIQNHTTEELIAVLAHEVGHFKKKHIILSFVLSLFQIFFMLLVLSLTVYNPTLSAALGGTQYAMHLNLLAFAILFSPISTLTGLLMSLYSRHNEYEADAYAKATYNGDALSTALKKLSVDTLTNLYPHPAYVFFHYSHPPLLQRLEALRHAR